MVIEIGLTVFRPAPPEGTLLHGILTGTITLPRAIQLPPLTITLGTLAQGTLTGKRLSVGTLRLILPHPGGDAPSTTLEMKPGTLTILTVMTSIGHAIV